MDQCIRERAAHKILTSLSDPACLVGVPHLGGVKKPLQRQFVSTPALVEQEIEPFEDGAQREDRGEQKRPHDRAALLEYLDETSALDELFQSAAPGRVERDQTAARGDETGNPGANTRGERSDGRLCRPGLRQRKT